MSTLIRHIAQRSKRAVEEAKTRGGMRVGMPMAHVDAGDLECLIRWAERHPSPNWWKRYVR